MWKSMISSPRASTLVSAIRLRSLQLQRTLSEVASEEVEPHIVANEAVESEITEVEHEITEVEHDIAENTMSRVKMGIPFWVAKTLIGAGGENIKQMSSEFNSLIKISKYGTSFPGTSEPVVLIEGERDDVIAAVNKTVDFVRSTEIPMGIKDRVRAERRQKYTRLIIPSSLSGKFIGKGGAVATKIREQFELESFSVQSREYIPEGFEERSIIISGEEENVKEAMAHVMEELRSQSGRAQLDDNLNY